MSAAPSAEYERILRIVRSWPPAERLSLVQAVLQTITAGDDKPTPTQGTLSQARGLLASRASAPTDAEVAQWLDERRRERYGI